jgi:hypothetical protein
LQAALDAVQAGQRILLDPAGAWPATYTIRKKAQLGRYRLTTEGAPDATDTRILTGGGLARIGGGSGPAFVTEPGAGDLEIDNVALLPSTDTGRWSTVVLLGTGAERDPLELPHDITLRRVHSVVDWTQQRQRRFVRAECAGFSLLDSYIDGYNHPTPDDAQAFITTNSPGPFLIQNCYLVATGENLLFGGGDPKIPNLVPGESGTIIRRCHLFKPLAWQTALRGTVKCLLEFKNARNVLVDGCVLENVWVDAQAGRALLLTVRNQDGTAPWSTLENIEIRNTRILNAPAEAIHILATDDTPGRLSVRARNLRFINLQTEQCARGAYINRGVDGLRFDHVTFADIKNQFLSFENGQTTGLAFVHCLARSGRNGIHSPTDRVGKPTLDAYAPGYVWGINGVERSTDPNTSIGYPAGTTMYPAGTIAYDAALGRYTPLLIGADGLPVGADLSGVADPR